MSATPPQRLVVLAEPGSALAHGLTAARLRGPSEDELRALERDLAAALGGAALLGAAAGAATAKGGGVVAGAAHAWLSMAAVKVTAVVVLAAAGTTVAVAWRRHVPLRERTTAVAARPDSPRARTLPAITTARTPTWPGAVAPPPLSAAVPPASPSRRFPETSPSPRRTGARRLPHWVTAGSVMEARPSARDPLPGEQSDLRDELSLITRAQHALPDDPSDALALAEEHGRRYGDPLLTQEREVIAVAALSKLGRTAEARARAERFIRRFPESAHVARLRRLAAGAGGRP